MAVRIKSDDAVKLAQARERGLSVCPSPPSSHVALGHLAQAITCVYSWRALNSCLPSLQSEMQKEQLRSVGRKDKKTQGWCGGMNTSGRLCGSNGRPAVRLRKLSGGGGTTTGL